MKTRHRFFNMYLTTTISVALVLFLIGLEAILLLSTHNLIRQVKENVSVTVILKESTDSTQLQRIENLLDVAPFVKEYRYISKEEALQEHITHLGEDPTAFLGFNPLQASIELNLQADYAQVDSIAQIESKLSVYPFVQEVLCRKDVVELLGDKLDLLSYIFIAIALVLLIIALALIINTIRLHVYSKRFLINTMKLVGATPWVIKSPIVKRNIGLGIIAACIAIALLAGAVYYCQQQLGIALFPLTWENVGLIAGVVVLSGMLITGLAAVFATNKYIRMKTDELYYV